MSDTVTGVHNYAILSGFNIYKPEQQIKLFRQYGDQGLSLFMMLKALGYKTPAAQDTYYHHEDKWKHVVFHSKGSVGAPGAGNSIDITLDPDDLDGDNRYYPKKWDQVIFPASEKTGVITDIDVTTPAEPVLTIEPNQATSDLGAVGAGDAIAIISGAHGEGSGQPSGDVSGFYRYENDAQIIKTTIEATGSELARELWFKVDDEGRGINGIYSEAMLGLEYRHALKISGALLLGERTTNTDLVDEDGNMLKTTEGWVPYIRRRGTVHDVAEDAFTVDDFDTIDRTLTRKFAPSKVLVMPGDKRHQDIENALKDYFEAATDFTTRVFNEDIFKGNESLGAAVNFKYLVKSERFFAFKRMGLFNHPQMVGADGFDFENKAIFAPMAKMVDGKTGDKIPQFGYRYREANGYSREAEVWQDGAAGNGVKIGDIDKKKTYMRSHVGAEFYGSNMILLEDNS